MGICAVERQNRFLIKQADNFFKCGQFSQAMQLFKKIIRKDASTPLIYLKVQQCCQAVQEYEEAISFYNELIRLNPENYIAYNYLGRAHEVNGEHQVALFCYKQSLHINSQYAQAESNLGLLLFEMGSWSQAIKHLLQAIELQPSDDLAYDNVSQFVSRQTNSNELQEMLVCMEYIVRKEGKNSPSAAKCLRILRSKMNHI